MGLITRIDPSPLWPNKLRFTCDTAMNTAVFGMDGSLWSIGNPAWVSAHSLNMQQADLGNSQNGQHPVLLPGTGDTKWEMAFGQQGPNLGNVFFGWNLDEASGTNCAEFSQPALDLTATGADPNGVEIVEGAWQKARRFSGSTAEVLQTVATPGGFGINSQASLGVFVFLEGPRTVPATIFSIQGDPANVVTGDDNEQFRVEVEVDGRITWYWEEGVRSPITGTTSRSLEMNRGHYLIVRRDIGASDFDVSVLVDGDLWQTWVGVFGPSGGTSADMRIGVGRQAVDALNPFVGILDQVQVLSDALTSAVIAQGMRLSVLPFPVNIPMLSSITGWKDVFNNDASLGITAFTLMASGYRSEPVIDQPTPSFETVALPDGTADASGTPPTVGTFDPALASAIAPTQAISFTVTRVTGSAFERIVILVSFPFLGLYEVAHDGDAFSQSYPASLGNSLAVLVPNTSQRYTLLREEGWPASPRILVLAIDDAGGITDITAPVYAWTLV